MHTPKIPTTRLQFPRLDFRTRGASISAQKASLLTEFKKMFFAIFSLFFIIPSIYCENAGEDVQGLSRKITLMKEKFDLEMSSVQANIQVLTGKVDKLEKSNSEQADEITNLKSQVQFLQEITKIVTVVESCSELSNHGIQESRKYDVDFDGKNNGEDPVNVFCQLPEGLTRIGEPVEATLENCNQPGCFEFDIDYNVSMTQIAALIKKSSTCSQSIEFNCFSAPLKVIFCFISFLPHTILKQKHFVF